MNNSPPALNALPAFVGIGAIKAGTTYLDKLLRAHPDLSLPSHLKETEFFTRHYGRGLDWYAGLFPADSEIRGEVSPQYVSSPVAANRIYSANPDALLLMAVRDPVQRVVSQYRHYAQETNFRGSIVEFCDRHPGAIERSRYHQQLQPWLSRFGLEAVHVILFEDLITDAENTSREIFEFLGVDARRAHAISTAAVNASFSPRFPRLYAAAKSASRFLYARGHARLVARMKSLRLSQALKIEASAQMSKVSDAEIEWLRGQLRDDAHSLSSLLKRDFARQWGTISESLEGDACEASGSSD